MYRVGIGYDSHKLVENRKLMLGGVEIPYRKGLSGHSDGDALIHAICDALLGAGSLGDIGTHFPSSDPKFKNISSLVLLATVKELIKKSGYIINNVDCTILAEEPNLAPYSSKMIVEISGTLQLDRSQISIKATTNKGMDAIGRGEGIAAHAIALISKIK